MKKSLKKICKQTNSIGTKAVKTMQHTSSKICKSIKSTASKKANVGGVVAGIGLGTAISIGASVSYTNGIAAAVIGNFLGIDD